MPDSSVNLASLSGQVDTRTTPGGDHRQVMALGNDGDTVAGLEPWGALQVNVGLTTLLYDSWSSALDTTDKWTVGGTAPTISGGTMTMSAAAGYHSLRGKDPHRPGAHFAYSRNSITLEATAGTGSSRFWGLGLPASSPSATVLAQDGIGFEVDAAGALFAVTYNAGVRTAVATLTRPADGAIHRYALYMRATHAYWFIDNLQVPVATTTFPNLAVVELPSLIARFNGTVTGVTFTNLAHLLGDTGAQSATIVDPIIGARALRVNADGSIATRNASLSTGTNSSVTAATTSTAILAASARRRAVLYNDSTSICRVACGFTASATAFTYLMDPGGTVVTDFDGAINAIWATANGAMRVTAMS